MIEFTDKMYYKDLKAGEMYYNIDPHASKYFYRVNQDLIYNLVLYKRQGKTFYYTLKGRWHVVPERDESAIIDKYFSEIMMENIL